MGVEPHGHLPSIQTRTHIWGTFWTLENGNREEYPLNVSLMYTLEEVVSFNFFLRHISLAKQTRRVYGTPLL